MTSTKALILIVEDEQPIRNFLRISLTNHGYRTAEAATAAEGLMRASEQPPELVILDLGLPDKDGMEVIRSLRQWSTAPIVVLSARGRDNDKIDALDVGADDYLTKPFSVGELLARVRVALRHAAGSAGANSDHVFAIQDLEIDFTRRLVLVAGVEIHLTPTEYRLLTIMAQHAGKVVTHRQLLKEVWGPDSVQENQYLRVYMGQLRRKLEADPARPRYLLTEPGIGYRLLSE